MIMSTTTDYLKFIHKYPTMLNDTQFGPAVRVGNIVAFKDSKQRDRIGINLHLRTGKTGTDKGVFLSYDATFASAHKFRTGDMVHFKMVDGEVKSIWAAKPDGFTINASSGTVAQASQAPDNAAARDLAAIIDSVDEETGEVKEAVTADAEDKAPY